MCYFLQQKFIARGSWCEVFDIGHGVCLKLYREKGIALIAYTNARIAEENNIGPKVYGHTDYGYYTEIVQVAEPEDINTLDRFTEIDKHHWFAFLIIEVFGRAAIHDLHCRNVGIAADGRLLMIDFEEEYWCE